MNLYWIAGLAILVLAEKLLPRADRIARLAGRGPGNRGGMDAGGPRLTLRRGARRHVSGFALVFLARWDIECPRSRRKRMGFRRLRGRIGPSAQTLRVFGPAPQHGAGRSRQSQKKWRISPSMRPSNKSRSRNKSSGHSNQRRVGNIINRVFDSAGPDGKVRGTPQQIIDKYNVLARDAQLSGDRVAAESYLQHAEHYSRLLGEAQRQQQEVRQNQEREDPQRGDGQRGGDQPSDPGRQRSGQSSSEGSGLTMIDIRDNDDSSGPVETPESRPAPKSPAPEEHPAEGAASGNGVAHPDQPPASEEAQPPKRPRARRRSKADSDNEAAAAK